MDLNGHEAGNGGNSQGKSKVHRVSSTRREPQNPLATCGVQKFRSAGRLLIAPKQALGTLAFTMLRAAASGVRNVSSEICQTIGNHLIKVGDNICGLRLEQRSLHIRLPPPADYVFVVRAWSDMGSGRHPPNALCGH